jgi:hypothetical protein
MREVADRERDSQRPLLVTASKYNDYDDQRYGDEHRVSKRSAAREESDLPGQRFVD